ncbi:MAG: hypothetical protein PUH91_14700, partial [Prevotella sp.]|nr:hypothetical protein [Prevotella sp.]
KREELTKISNLIAANLKDESTDEEISTALKNNEGYAEMMQSVYNRGVSETNKKYEGYIKPEPPASSTTTPPPAQTETTPPPSGLTAEQVQKMISDGIAAGLKPYKEKEERERLDNLLQSSDKLKDVPEVFRRQYRLEKEEDLDNMLTKITNDYTALKQTMVSSGQFVAAPTPSALESEDDDFRKMMEASANRIADANKQ